MKKILIILGSLFPVLLFSYITVSGDVSGQSWTNQTYYVSGNITVYDDATLSIASGAVVKFSTETGLTVYGTLDVNGTLANYVIFTSMHDNDYGDIIEGSTGTPLSGRWQGIYLYGFLYRDGIGEFDYCRVRYGGTSSGYADANICFNRSDSGHFINSFCEYSQQHGIRASICPVEISNSSFENCQYPAYLSNVTIKTYPNNSATGNLINAFVISGGCVTENMTWTETSTSVITLLIGTLTINDDIVCTITEGTIIKFTNSGQFSVIGTLDVNGTETNPVVFTSFQDDTFGGDTNNDGNSTSPAPGDWQGIHLNGNQFRDGIGEFDHCRIRYGGYIFCNVDANVNFHQSDSGHFTNSICEYSLQAGVKINGTSPVFRGSTFEDNTGYGVYVTGDSNPDFGTITRDQGLNTFINNDSGNYQFYNDTSNDINAYFNIWEYAIADSIDA
ncbi:MAG: hypothetical protein KAW88_03600, partial [Candidatus Cloacimonetes bacterium]|nr:hypothetical protein [Candidatus Cloacimonadota bacterium]